MIGDTDDTRPHIGAEHPVARATHAMIDAAALAVKVQDIAGTDGGMIPQWAAEIVDQCGFAMERLAEALELLEHTERALAQLTEEKIRDKSKAFESYLTLLADHEATKRLCLRLEEWNRQLVGQMASARAALDPRKRRPRGVDTDTAPQALRIEHA